MERIELSDKKMKRRTCASPDSPAQVYRMFDAGLRAFRTGHQKARSTVRARSGLGTDNHNRGYGLRRACCIWGSSAPR